MDLTILIPVLAGVILAVIVIAMVKRPRTKVALDSPAARTQTPTREFVDRVADDKGVVYAQYRVTDASGNMRMGYCRIIPTTFRYTCPDCGGAVVGADARRVQPAGTGPEPTAYRCEGCGRQEAADFGVPHVEEREGEMTFETPSGAQPACPQGGQHDWHLEDTHADIVWPEGVDQITENLVFTDEVEYQTWRCSKCDETKSVETVLSRGQSVP